MSHDSVFTATLTKCWVEFKMFGTGFEVQRKKMQGVKPGIS